MAEEAETTPVVAEGGDAPAAEEPVVVKKEEVAALDPMTALKEVLTNALISDGLKRGLHEVVKVLDRETAHLCCLASDCNEPAYTRLVKGLCHQNNISLLMVPTGQELGEWCGICKIDEDGNPRKVRSCSAAAITNYGRESDALTFLLNYMKKNAKAQ